VTDDDVSDNDMPNFPWQGRQDAPESAAVTALLAELAAAPELPAGPPPDLRPVADALAALEAGPARDELAGEAVALAAFRAGSQATVYSQSTVHSQATVHSRTTGRRRSRRPFLLSPLVSARTAAVAIIAALSLGSVATAAYTGALPAPMQRFAHDVFGAPPAGSHPGSGPASAQPAATGYAALRLCNAWAEAKANGNAEQKAAAFRNLATAAGGAANVAAYCAAAPHTAHPGETPPGQGEPTSHPAPHGSGPPTSHPAPHGSGKPTSHPSPSRKPTTHPSPSRKPTSHP
jgi:hypothetical protein